ncbi:nucleotide exchange factor GrpE [Candidatus Micrarchaeota archaeon]|nr:nucleotide exchange factor GrpE [Candidatus Micrarchaeota archaeon]
MVITIADDKKTIGNQKFDELKAPPEEKLVEHEKQDLLEEKSGTHEKDQKLKELADRMLRMQADFENYKKRTAKENESMREFANVDLLLKLLTIVDDFEIALDHVEQSKSKEFKTGMELLYAKFLDLLKKEGVDGMKVAGEKFDPYKHEALRQGEGEEGKIVEVMQKGYLFRGKVLRHAKVVVGMGQGEKK